MKKAQAELPAEDYSNYNGFDYTKGCSHKLPRFIQAMIYSNLDYWTLMTKVAVLSKVERKMLPKFQGGILNQDKKICHRYKFSTIMEKFEKSGYYWLSVLDRFNLLIEDTNTVAKFLKIFLFNDQIRHKLNFACINDPRIYIKFVDLDTCYLDENFVSHNPDWLILILDKQEFRQL